MIIPSHLGLIFIYSEIDEKFLCGFNEMEGVANLFYAGAFLYYLPNLLNSGGELIVGIITLTGTLSTLSFLKVLSQNLK